MAYGSSHYYNCTNMSFEMQVLLGLIPNWEPLVIRSYNSAVNNGADAIIWNNNTDTHTFLTAVATMKVSSTSALDTSAGTGARTIKVCGLDSNYDRIEEIITMNGTTVVNTTNQYIRINDVIVITAGSTQVNQGTIYVGTGTVTSGTNSIPCALIRPTDGRSYNSIYTVPRNMRYIIEDIRVTGGTENNALRVSLWAYDIVNNALTQDAEFDSRMNYIENPVVPRRLIPEKTDVYFTAILVNGNNNKMCHIEYKGLLNTKVV